MSLPGGKRASSSEEIGEEDDVDFQPFEFDAREKETETETEIETEQPSSMFSPASVDLLRSHVKESLIRNQRKAGAGAAGGEEHPSSTSDDASQLAKTSLPDIVRMAAATFINSCSDEAVDPLLLPPNEEVGKQVELLQHLLRAAEEMGRHKYEHAICSLDICDSMSSRTGNLTQRLVHYLAHALRERAHNRSGVHITSLHVDDDEVVDVEEAIAAPSPIVAVIYGKIPFYQVGQLAGVQAIVDSVEKSKRIHIIDLKIRNGMQWTALMQALSSRKRGPPEILKITAIVTNCICERSTSLVHETGERLANFAHSMDIPFAFRAVAVPDMLELDVNDFDLDPRDTVAIFAEYGLHDLISRPNQLDAFMVFIRNDLIRPAVMVVIETEANFNSLNFSHRFVEVLFHYSAYFDCLDTCFDPEDQNRGVLESMFLSSQVSDILVKEDKEMLRSVPIEAWRKFFGRFWMVEAGLSPTAIETVYLLLDRFSGGRCCTVDLDGRSLVAGWKGTPVFSISTWKFLVAKPLVQTYKKKHQTNTFGFPPPQF